MEHLAGAAAALAQKKRLSRAAAAKGQKRAEKVAAAAAAAAEGGSAPPARATKSAFLQAKEKQLLAEEERKRLALERAAAAAEAARVAARGGLLEKHGLADDEAEIERELWNLGWDVPAAARAVTRGTARTQIAAAAVAVARFLAALEKAKRGEGPSDVATALGGLEEAEANLENEKQDACVLEWQLQEAQDASAGETMK